MIISERTSVSPIRRKKITITPKQYQEETIPLHLLARAIKQSRLEGGALRTSIQCKLYALKLNWRRPKPKRLHINTCILHPPNPNPNQRFQHHKNKQSYNLPDTDFGLQRHCSHVHLRTADGR